MAAEPDVDALVAAAHARGVRVLFDVVPHHTHTQHPYWLAHEHDGWFQDIGGGCVCGVGSCSWATDETACWFTSYLPSLDWTDDDVASTVTSDVRWWMDRFDGDGVRIDAVPMMPRAAIRRIAWDIRSEYDGPAHRSMVMGENYTGQDDWPSLKFFLGPTGLDSEFHFPLMWALRGAIAGNAQTLEDVDLTIRTGEQTWSGSGAVMGLILDNHDVSRFITVAAGDDDGVTWTPAPQPTLDTPYTLEQLALGRDLHAARRPHPLLRRRDRPRGQERPRLAPRHARRRGPDRPADADPRLRADPGRGPHVLRGAAPRHLPDAARRPRAAHLRPRDPRRPGRHRRPPARGGGPLRRPLARHFRGNVGRCPVGATSSHSALS